MTYWGTRCANCGHPRLNHVDGTQACEAGACRCPQFTPIAPRDSDQPGGANA